MSPAMRASIACSCASRGEPPPPALGQRQQQLELGRRELDVVAIHDAARPLASTTFGQVLDLLAGGASLAEAARTLYVSLRTANLRRPLIRSAHLG